ncbi:hypothetical protein [Tropicimonas isoalkanivorans]|uniref:Uncharacterized protein n=1 Tax=Tropicimonas isoalkanivorans TaxID=441112 RepID=A0A1I1E9Q6_9RHOB|nr:hypothetical protein [Tropicimonas isoalkanivorans]SFB82048.1 hypothetical protein SAMN04488094_101634 [Tropicimonas isoalkanivorans]
MNDFPKTTKFKAATALACKIAGVNSDRFNEAVHAGHYPCAPATSPGRARRFDVNDIIALRLYQQDIESGLSPSKAGHKACEIRAFLLQHPDADQVYIVTPALGSPYYLPDFDTTQRHATFAGSPSPEIIRVEVLNFHYLRGRIVHEIDDEAMTVGRD